MKTLSTQQLKELTPRQFPRTAKYDPLWVVKNQMGPNALWLTEGLVQKMSLKPGMKVLDMACGKAMSAIFLAKEYGIEVWASDLKVSIADNEKRVVETGLMDKIIVSNDDARDLPFEKDFFDAVICIDAFEYFGTSEDYIDYLSQFVKPGGQVGMINAGLRQEFDGKVPAYLQPFWLDEFDSFHSADWWRSLWEKSKTVAVTDAWPLTNGERLWLKWEELTDESVDFDVDSGFSSVKMLRADKGRNLTFVCVVGTRKTS